MTTQGEMEYFEVIGDDGRTHAAEKPFSDVDRGGMLLELGAVLSLLPPPDARVLDCGCGAGWLTWMLQRCGYRATGVDVAPAAIALAREQRPYGDALDPPEFVVGDVQDLGVDAAFDAVLFFDSLHHVLDETATLRGALRALKPGGVCITSEPGSGHAAASAHQIEAYGVTERDMPAAHIAKTGLAVGFERAELFPRADDFGTRVYRTGQVPGSGWKDRLRTNPVVRAALTIKSTELAKRDHGIVVLTAPAP